jgi:mono/diheme cytochrome c family protein
LRLLLLPFAALALAGCGTGGIAAENADVSDGKILFKQECGSCHTLKEAGTAGTIGPNLDEAFATDKEEGFDESAIREVVRHQIDYAAPPMPQELVKGDDADAVAADAGTTGKVGPNLDQAKPSLQKATTQITNGGGGMPAFKGQLTEEQIKTLAQYVVRVTKGGS